MTDWCEIREQTIQAAEELIGVAGLSTGDVVVVGCSSSEVGGARIGTDSSPEIGRVIFEGVRDVLDRHGLFLAAQCCEHLNRCLIVERAVSGGLMRVNVVPQPKAGGSFATAAYQGMNDPVAVEAIQADAGLDIGRTMIGMHLRAVAVPVRLTHNRIGQADVAGARVRPKYIGGPRAHYDEKLM